MLKKIILTLSLSLLAFADENTSKEVIVEFIKENANIVETSTNGFIGASEVKINDLENITWLFITDKVNIKNIPLGIGYLQSLWYLKILNTKIKELPNEFGNLINLKWLELNDNKIEQLPTSIGELKNLTSLGLSNNRLVELPKELYNLPLSSLGLSNNLLKELPPEIGNLTNLGGLSLENNQLKILPSEIGNLVHLNYLNLTNNELTSIDENISNITTLLKLKLGNNKLKTLPKGVGNSRNLIELDVSNNDLRELPKEIGNICSYAREFNYPYRKVSREAPPLPECIIDVRSNKLSYLPQEIAKIKYLPCGGVEFDGNYFDKLPISFKRIDFGLLFPAGYKISCATPNNFESLGYEFYSLLIDYSFEDNKTVTFKPILGDDLNITSYLWSFGDGNTSTLESPTHTYKYYRNYKITLTLNGGEYSTSKLISVYPRVLELKKGWNMITPPTKDDINASLFDTVWSYQNDIWEHNHSYLIPTIGYWVKLNQDLNYSSSGEVYQLPNYKIKSGWNFLGSGENWFKKENETIYQYKNSEWLINPREIKRGDGFWVKRD